MVLVLMAPQPCVCGPCMADAEWGDRSQIATITLAATFNPIGVTLGVLMGHCLCTGTAVMGGKVLHCSKRAGGAQVLRVKFTRCDSAGRLIAQRISQRTVAICGGTLFLIFAVMSL